MTIERYNDKLRNLIEPLPFFNTLMDDYFPNEFVEEVFDQDTNKLKDNVNQARIKEILLNHAQQFEKYLLSYMHIYKNLIQDLISEFDKEISLNTSFHMEPLAGEEKTYIDVSIYSQDIKEVPPEKLFSHVKSSPFIKPEDLSLILSLSLSKSQFPNTKLEAIQKFSRKDTNPNINLNCKDNFTMISTFEKGGNNIDIQQVAEFEASLEKWQNEFPIDFSSSPTHTFHVDNYEINAYEHYILLDTSEGRYIFNITKQIYYFNGTQCSISDFYKYNLLNIAIINRKLVIIGCDKVQKINITKFKTDRLSSNEVELSQYIDSQIQPGDFNCNIIENNLYILSKDSIMDVFDINTMNRFDDPDKYIFLCHANFFNDKIYTAAYDGKTIFAEIRNIPAPSMYTNIIQPTSTQHNHVAVCMIASEMINAITKVYEIIIEGKNTDNSFAFQNLNHIDFSYNLFNDIHLMDLPQRIIDFIDILILRFAVLNYRQLAAVNPNIDIQRQMMLTKMFQYFKEYSLLFRESVDMIFKSVKIGIYSPAIIKIFNKVFKTHKKKKLSVEYLKENPQNIFIKQNLDIEHRKFQVMYFRESLSNMCYLIKTNKTVSYDSEFIPIVKFMFKRLTKLSASNNKKAAVKLFKIMLQYFAVIPVGFHLAIKILNLFKEIPDELTQHIINRQDFKTISDLFSKDQRCTYSSVKLDTTIFAHKNECSDTTIKTPFQTLQVKTNNFKKGETKNENVFFNQQEPRTDVEVTLVDGNNLDIQIIGNYQDYQYEISGTATNITNLDNQSNMLYSSDWTISLYPFVIKKLLDSVANGIKETEEEVKFKDILALEKYDQSNQEFHDKIIEISQRNEFKEGTLERKIIAFYGFRRIPSDQNLLKALCKIALAGIWIKRPIDEFNDLINGNTPAPIFKEICSKFTAKANLTSMIQKDKAKFAETVEKIDKKFDYLLSHQTNQIDIELRKISDFFNSECSVTDVKKVATIVMERKRIPRTIKSFINYFVTKDTLISNKSIRRSFFQLINIQTQDMLELVLNDSQDPCVLIHLLTIVENINVEDDMKNSYYKEIGRKLITLIRSIKNAKSNDESFVNFDVKLAQMTYAIQQIDPNELEPVIPRSMGCTKRELCARPGRCAYNVQELMHIVPIYINKCRNDISIRNELISMINPSELDDQAYTAMIALGAEIFGPSITRYVLENGQKKSINDVKRLVDQIAVFKTDPPPIRVNSDTNNLIKQLLKKINLDTRDPQEAVKNCITISFINKVYNVQSQRDQFESFSESNDLIQKVNQMKFQKCSTSVYIKKIRSSLKMAALKREELRNHMFVNLTFCESIDGQQFQGCADTDSFFVYTKSINDMEGIHFKIPVVKNGIKYIGFVDDDWNTVFLSFFDKTIYTNNNYTYYTGNLSEFTIGCTGQFLVFDNQKINCEIYKTRWIFVITVADNSVISFQYKKIQNTNSDTTAMICHSFNVKDIFPKICLGKQADLPEFYDVSIESVDNNLRKFKVFAVNTYNNQYELFNISGHQMTPVDTPFSQVIENAMFAHKIGDCYQNLMNHLENCNNYCLSMLNSMFASSGTRTFTMLANLTTSSSRDEVNRIISSIGSTKNDVIKIIREQLVACDKDNSVPVCSNFSEVNSLMKDYGQYHMAYFNGWYHGILFEKTFDSGIKLFFDYQKVCKGMIPYILGSFQSKIPTDLNMAKLYLKFFNLPNITNPFGSVNNFAEYLNNLITFIFERDPGAVLYQKGISDIIIQCAKSMIPQLYNLGQSQSNGAKRVPPLILYAHGDDVGPRWEKFLQKNNKNFYPMEITKYDGTKMFIAQNNFTSTTNVKCGRYHFGTNAQKVLDEWREAKQINFSACYKELCLINLRHLVVPSSLGFNPVVIYFCHIGLSTFKDIPMDYFDMNGPRKSLYVRRESLKNGNYPEFSMSISKSYSRTKSYIGAVTVIDELSKCQGFPGDLKDNERFYYVKFAEENGIDAGGLFRDTFNIMVTELMDVNFKYFVHPPRTLSCEQDCLIPSISLSDRISYCIGAVLSAAILCNCTHKLWNMPLFIWDYLVAPNGTKLSEIVDCTDVNWLNGLEQKLIKMKQGFHYYLPQNLVANLWGNYIRILAIGNVSKLDYNTFTKYLKNCGGPFDVFKAAISNFTSEELVLLLKFITGCETPPIDPEFKIEVKMASQDTSVGEQNYDFPFAHTCFRSIDIPPYTNSVILREKLRFAINSASTMEDNICRIC